MASANFETSVTGLSTPSTIEEFGDGDFSSSNSLCSSTPLTSPETSSPDIASLQESLSLNNDSTFVMVVGGLGYIGSHTTLELLKEGYNVIIVDNLSNSYEGVLSRIRILAMDYCVANMRKLPMMKFYNLDYRSPEMRTVAECYLAPAVGPILSSVQHGVPEPRRSRISGLIHFAAYKSIEESIQNPLSYYQNNVCGLVDFLVLLEELGIRNLVFSSSATVYGAKSNEGRPLREEDLIHHHETFIDHDGKKSIRLPGVLGLNSPYGRSKYFSEAILADLAHAESAWNIISLRYFNPVGCHESGILGEDPRQKPTNLFPVVMQVLMGSKSILEIFGSDWETHDGTAIRDYIHVVDLARGHVAALEAAANGALQGSFRAFNLGSGKGASVSEVIKSVEEASSHTIPVSIVERRVGDVGYCVAATDRVEKELGWKSERSLHDCARDTWNFICKSSNSNDVEA